MNASIGQMQNQIEAMTSKLNQAPAQPAVPAAATAVGPAATPATAKHRTAAENKRLKEMQAKLDDQQQQLKDTQDQVAQTRSDLEANLGSAREDLNGSIARTHDELVSLEQRGERSYFEFDLTRAKHFQREGPIMVSLRKVDQKHKRYDLALVVDDNQVSKNNVNVFEPVWINGTDMQQVQLVVNKVDKDHVHGYVSAPKYVQSASMTPVSVRTDSANPNDTNSSPTTNPSGTSGDTSPTTPEQPQ
jgi:septal ring factor EnvC (AmiA/AmiB activator)